MFTNYSMREYYEENDYILNAPSMSEVIAQEKAEQEKEEKEQAEWEQWCDESEAYLRNAEKTFDDMLALMNEQPSFENFVGLMGAYDMVSDASKEVYGYRCRPSINLTNPLAIAIRNCANLIPLKEWLEYKQQVYAKHSR